MSRIRQPGKLKEIAQSAGMTIEEFVPFIIREHGSIGAAAGHLNIGTNTLQYWLKKLGYTVETTHLVTLTREVSNGD